MSFEVTADAYDRYMGRFALVLAPLFAEFVGFRQPWRVLDVGCGPGTLTGELATRLGTSAVSAVDPSASMVSATRSRHPEVDVRKASAERLPFPDATFDAAVAQLVVHFMSDPVAGLREMARVTKVGGVVAACVWDREDGASSLLWQAAAALDVAAPGEGDRPGTGKGDLVRLFGEAGMTPDSTSELRVSRKFVNFEDWWEPFTLGVGGAGGYVASLDPTARARLMERCRALVPSGPFVLAPRVWAVRATLKPDEDGP